VQLVVPLTSEIVPIGLTTALTPSGCDGHDVKLPTPLPNCLACCSVTQPCASGLRVRSALGTDLIRVRSTTRPSVSDGIGTRRTSHPCSHSGQGSLGQLQHGRVVPAASRRNATPRQPGHPLRARGRPASAPAGRLVGSRPRLPVNPRPLTVRSADLLEPRAEGVPGALGGFYTVTLSAAGRRWPVGGVRLGRSPDGRRGHAGDVGCGVVA
jgi:hypothetical protein